MSAPTREQVSAAYRSLRNRGVEQVGDFSLGTLAELSRGGPSHDPDRYTDAEQRLAHEVLVRAWLHVEEATGRQALDELFDELVHALGLPSNATPSDVVAAVEHLDARGQP